MMRSVILPAVLTGAFCAAFAVGIDLLTDMLQRNQLVVVSFASGFLGSVFAKLILGARK